MKVKIGQLTVLEGKKRSRYRAGDAFECSEERALSMGSDVVILKDELPAPEKKTDPIEEPQIQEKAPDKKRR